MEKLLLVKTVVDNNVNGFSVNNLYYAETSPFDGRMNAFVLQRHYNYASDSESITRHNTVFSDEDYATFGGFDFDRNMYQIHYQMTATDAEGDSEIKVIEIESEEVFTGLSVGLPIAARKPYIPLGTVTHHFQLYAIAKSIAKFNRNGAITDITGAFGKINGEIKQVIGAFAKINGEVKRLL